MKHRIVWQLLVVLALTLAACSSGQAELTTAGDSTDTAIAESSDGDHSGGAVADDSAPREVVPAGEPLLAFCASSGLADGVNSSNIDGVTLDFESESYVAGEDATYEWTTGTIDFVTSFYFTVECWDGDRWRSAWRAFVFNGAGYQSLSIPLGDVPAIGYGPTPGTVVIPPSAPAGTYRLVVRAPARDEAAGEKYDQMLVTGGFVVDTAPTTTEAPAGASTTVAPKATNPPPAFNEVLSLTPGEVAPGADVSIDTSQDGMGGWFSLEIWNGDTWQPTVAALQIREVNGTPRTIELGETVDTDALGFGRPVTVVVPPSSAPGTYRVCVLGLTDCGVVVVR